MEAATNLVKHAVLVVKKRQTQLKVDDGDKVADCLMFVVARSAPSSGIHRMRNLQIRSVLFNRSFQLAHTKNTRGYTMTNRYRMHDLAMNGSNACASNYERLGIAT